MIKRIVDIQPPVAEVATGFGASIRTAFKWLARFRAQGLPGLHDRSSRPHCSPKTIHPLRAARVPALRRRRLPGFQIARAAKLSKASVSRLLRRPAARLAALSPPPPIRRYERQHPGDLLHFDIKKLARIVRTGHRVPGDRQRNPTRGAGWEFLHIAIDDHSRISFAQRHESWKRAHRHGLEENGKRTLFAIMKTYPLKPAILARLPSLLRRLTALERPGPDAPARPWVCIGADLEKAGTRLAVRAGAEGVCAGGNWTRAEILALAQELRARGWRVACGVGWRFQETLRTAGATVFTFATEALTGRRKTHRRVAAALGHAGAGVWCANLRGRNSSGATLRGTGRSS